MFILIYFGVLVAVTAFLLFYRLSVRSSERELERCLSEKRARTERIAAQRAQLEATSKQSREAHLKDIRARIVAEGHTSLADLQAQLKASNERWEQYIAEKLRAKADQRGAQNSAGQDTR